jgi:hypothetical protein
VRRLYWREPPADQYDWLGLTVDDLRPPVVQVLPENERAFNVFCSMGTQWREGATGPVGLDYGALPFVLRMMGVRRDEWPRVWDSLRVCELAALEEMHKD